MSSKSISDLTRPLCGRIGSLVFLYYFFFRTPIRSKRYIAKAIAHELDAETFVRIGSIDLRILPPLNVKVSRWRPATANNQLD